MSWSLALGGLVLVAVAEAEDVPAAPDEGAPREKVGWFKRIRYEVGVGAQLGGGTDGSMLAEHWIVEPLAFELRSFLTPRFALHTTLNLSRMIVPAAADGDGRIDYDCHLAGHVPVDGQHTFVIAPGAAIGYSLTGSRYQRFVGGARIGVDIARGAWTGGFYARPYGGWYREVGASQGRPVVGALVEVVQVYKVPRRRDRAR